MAEPSPERVIAAYNATVTQVRARVVEFATGLWVARGSYRDADVDWLVSQIVPRVQAGQVQVANLTAAYIAQIASLRLGRPVPPVQVDRDAVLNGRGVPAADVYRRPAVEMYTALAGGLPFAEAVDRSVRRLESLAGTDVQMARVRQARASMIGAGVPKYRRVLVGATNCALCMIASTQRYHRGELSPIHPGCNCGVEPIFFGEEPDRQVIDNALLRQVHTLVAGEAGQSEARARSLGLGKFSETGVSDYTDLIITRNHGEYGPTLSWRKDRFTTAAGLA